jgi:hypothetical protein
MARWEGDSCINKGVSIEEPPRHPEAAGIQSSVVRRLEIHQEVLMKRGHVAVVFRFSFSFALDLKSEIKQELFYNNV